MVEVLSTIDLLLKRLDIYTSCLWKIFDVLEYIGAAVSFLNVILSQELSFQNLLHSD